MKLDPTALTPAQKMAVACYLDGHDDLDMRDYLHDECHRCSWCEFLYDDFEHDIDQLVWETRGVMVCLECSGDYETDQRDDREARRAYAGGRSTWL